MASASAAVAAGFAARFRVRAFLGLGASCAFSVSSALGVGDMVWNWPFGPS